MKKLIPTLVVLLFVFPCQANPIPVPPPASMPLEDMHVQIQPHGEGLRAIFTGDFTFTYIPEDVNSMLFPVPPDACNVGVWQDEVELSWTWSAEEYPTILPEIPTIPMIEWQGPFPLSGAVFRVDYEHSLIERPDEFIFFYALGTGKYFPTYEKTTTAYFDILLPPGFCVAGVWLDETPHEYEVVDGHLMITVQSQYGPIVNDLIVSLVPSNIYVATDGNDITGDGSQENPFRTIQKGIDTAIDCSMVIAQPGLYYENINFVGKNITVTSIEPANWNVVRSTTIEADYEFDPNATVTFRGTEGANCTLAGFNINGFIRGYDRSTDPYGDNHTRATITHCLLEDNFTGCDPLIESCDGTIRNCVIAGLWTLCDAVLPAIWGCNGLIENCTIANNGYALHIGSAETCTIENSIICEGVHSIWVGGTVNIRYSDVLGGMAAIYCPAGCTVNWGPGNIDADPRFADRANSDFHLQSAAGRWDPNSQTWVTDANTSLSIDAGNPGCPPGDEPAPNGNRINMGAYGGTAEASKSPPDWALLADLTNDRKVDFNDLAVFVDYWPAGGRRLPADLDRNGTVDFKDYCIYALQWMETAGDEPGMTYEIGECDFGATDANAGEPNFSVWVEGRYIHFEDMMYANCCPDELRLEQEINGSQITLYEIGYDGSCDCMCWFPVTATLGPFPDGTYTVEVIDNLGQSLGVVEVVIGGPTKPGIAYQIEDCNLEAAALFLTEQSESTRFTVTVEGQYIHFEDMMVANCCPDELGLEMTVEGNIITVYETEYTPGGCWCICDYPVTATLGPFEPGTYTLEVYEDWGGFIGSTTVTIGSGP